MPHDVHRRLRSISLQEAAQAAPSLTRLYGLVRESSERLEAIRPLLPPALRACVQAGPIDEDGCLLVNNSAAAAKLRQLLPALQAALRARGLPVRNIRLKLQTGRG